MVTVRVCRDETVVLLLPLYLLHSPGDRPLGAVSEPEFGCHMKLTQFKRD
jgi:hypothetical protein